MLMGQPRARRGPEGNESNPEGFDVRNFRRKRRLSDAILIAFHNACDQEDIEVAWGLLNVLDDMTTRPSTGRHEERRRRENLVAAHERLWLIRHAKHAQAEIERRNDMGG
jgi:hypothetical protein